MSNHTHAHLPVATFDLDSKALDDYDEDDLALANDAIPNSSSVPSLWGIPLKYISLVTLAVQNSMLTIIMHYSRVSTPPSRAYSAATAVLMNEILKGLVSLLIAFARIEPSTSAKGSLWSPQAFLARVRRMCREVFSPDCWKLSIPAILYVIQNNLQYVAASNLEAATFQVTYQMKILTTAGFSVLLLRKKLSPNQWLSLLFLAIGVGVVQIQTGSAKVDVPAIAASLHDVHAMSVTKGFMAVAAACFTSGLAGVYFEMVLKNSPNDLWIRNVQLSLFSLLPALAPVLFKHVSGPAPEVSGWFAALFHGFGAWAWATVLVQVFGGLVTAMVIKYADNILKGFATSLSIVISFLASVALFDFEMTLTFVLGSAIVLVATWLYNQPPKRTGLVVGKEALSWSLGQLEKVTSGTFSRSSAGSEYTELRPISPSSSLASLSSTAPNTPPLPDPFTDDKERSRFVF